MCLHLVESYHVSSYETREAFCITNYFSMISVRQYLVWTIFCPICLLHSHICNYYSESKYSLKITLTLGPKTTIKPRKFKQNLRTWIIIENLTTKLTPQKHPNKFRCFLSLHFMALLYYTLQIFSTRQSNQALPWNQTLRCVWPPSYWSLQSQGENESFSLTLHKTLIFFIAELVPAELPCLKP